MRRPDGPTARVLQLAVSRPGTIITWSEAQAAYALGIVEVITGAGPRTQVQRRRGASHHKMSVSNLLKRHFERVDGTMGMYVLRTTIGNPDWDEDMEALQVFHGLYGSDEFGMSTRPTDVCSPGTRTCIVSRPLARMSDIRSDWSGASASIVGGDFNGAGGRIT